jgi:hypothetical protein
VNLGPHPDNLRGELALEQIHFVKEATWPGVQHDIERKQVVAVPEVEIVRCDAPLTPTGSAYGIRRPGEETVVPISPGVSAFCGRYRAWLLPTSGVAVAVEPLDDELSYLREHRRIVLERQEADPATFIPLGKLRKGRASEFGLAPDNALRSLFGYVSSGFVRAYYEGPLEMRPARYDHGMHTFAIANDFLDMLVIGAIYRIRPTTDWRRIVEPVVPEEVNQPVGPYR